MGGDTNLTQPIQPSYGEALKDSLSAQVDLLRGKGAFEGTGGLRELTEQYEKPLRETTAQIDTDVLRQTILGGEQKVVKDPETGKYGIPGAEIVTSEQVGGDAPTQSAGGRYQMVQTVAFQPRQGIGTPRDLPAQYSIIDTQTGGMLDVPGQGGRLRPGEQPPDQTNLQMVPSRFNELNASVAAAAGTVARKVVASTIEAPLALAALALLQA